MVQWSNAVKLRRSLLIALAGALVVTGGVVVAARATKGGEDNAALAKASKVLQAVNVNVAPNGDLTAIRGTSVGTTTDGDSFTSQSDYTPRTTAKDLPVRVLTAYHTAKKSGTDLQDLDGYTGPVDIQLTVQNLTQKSTNVTYDVGGVQRTQSALVGVPLTVVASTKLDGTKPSAVRTLAGKSTQATNGVLSQDKDGKAQVQWATILAPPQLGSSTTMTLAVDAKDFKVPDFDISVQPGLVTDPSVGALIDSAFNPSDSSQMRLEQRTIDLITDVNVVLARAGKSMDKVRTTLSDSSKTLGDKTVTDLKESNKSIATSVKDLKSSVTQLGGDLSKSLNSTKSQTLTELSGLVESIDALLGNTSTQPVTITPVGTGCDVTVPKPNQAASVYGNLMEIVGLLNGYAGASDACKEEVRTAVTAVIGPDLLATNLPTDLPTNTGNAQTDRENAATNAANDKTNKDNQAANNTTCQQEANIDSVTCALFGAGAGLQFYAAQFLSVRDDVVNAINGLDIDGLTAAVKGPAVTDPDNPNTTDGLLPAATELIRIAQGKGGVVDVTGARNALTSAQSQAASIRSIVTTLQDQFGGDNKLVDTNNALADKICGSIGGSGLTQEQADALMTYVSKASCEHRGTSAVDNPNSMEAQMDAIGSTLDGLATSLDSLDGALANVGTELDKLQSSTGDGAINAQAAILQGQANRVGAAAKSIDEKRAGAISQINSTMNTAYQKVQEGSNLTKQIRKVYDNGQVAGDQLGVLFDRSKQGLLDAGTEIQENGKKTVEAQKRAFAGEKNTSATRISAAVNTGLKQVDQGVSSSTTDMSGAQKLLQSDLLNVLSDLGTRDVKGSGLLGAMSRSAATTGSANYALGLATDTASSYSNVRQGDVAGLFLQQAQADAAQQMQANLPAFHLALPASADHRTVYSFHLHSGS